MQDSNPIIQPLKEKSIPILTEDQKQQALKKISDLTQVDWKIEVDSNGLSYITSGFDSLKEEMCDQLHKDFPGSFVLVALYEDILEEELRVATFALPIPQGLSLQLWVDEASCTVNSKAPINKILYDILNFGKESKKDNAPQPTPNYYNSVPQDIMQELNTQLDQGNNNNQNTNIKETSNFRGA